MIISTSIGGHLAVKKRHLSRLVKTSKCILGAIVAYSISIASIAENGTMLQAFDWDTDRNGEHWNRLAADAQTWVDRGITAFWLPPAYKGHVGVWDVGYGVYDLWDLGEFDQKGTVRTKYGTKQEYLDLIDAIHAANGFAYADIVLNHKMGPDEIETHQAVTVARDNRNFQFSDGDFTVQSRSRFTFEGRKDEVTGELAYNDFEWRWYHFDGSDYVESHDCDNCIFRFSGEGKSWDSNVSLENGNYDYLLALDIDFEHPEVRDHFKEWGVWYTTVAKLDGFRLDAVKHMPNDWYNEWLYHVREGTGRQDLFAVAEYWQNDLGALNYYTDVVNSGPNNRMSVMDVTLHQNLSNASNAGFGSYDMGSIYNNTLVASQPGRAVTFVDNHDTLDGRSLASKVQDWFKPSAYALILLRAIGYPTVFLGDYDGVENNVTSHKFMLDQMMAARKYHAYGAENTYFDDQDVVGFTREGNADHWYGVAVLMSDRNDGSKWMYAGNAHANACFRDITGNDNNTVCTNGDGWGEFRTKGGRVSVWVRDGKFKVNQN